MERSVKSQIEQMVVDLDDYTSKRGVLQESLHSRFVEMQRHSENQSLALMNVLSTLQGVLLKGTQSVGSICAANESRFSGYSAAITETSEGM